MSKQKPVAVVFAKPWRGYNKGETAGFDKETADALRERGIVEEEGEEAGRRTRTKAEGGKKAETPPTPPDDPAKGADSDDNARP